jgi:hypothetical protein
MNGGKVRKRDAVTAFAGLNGETTRAGVGADIVVATF